MAQNTLIAARLTELFLDGKWIANTNYKALLQSINWQQATQQIASLNTIALLAFHVNYYLVGLLQVFDGGELTIKDKYSFDAPPIQSAADWDSLVAELLTNAQRFVDKVALMDDNDLAAAFVRPEYGTYLRNIEAVIEHSYYHLGQISLLKKMVSA